MTPFPQYLSSPMQVLWFESDEMGVICSLFVIALFFGGVLSWMALFIVPVFYGKLKKKRRGFFAHCLYVLGILKFKRYPIYFEKEFHE